MYLVFDYAWIRSIRPADYVNDRVTRFMRPINNSQFDAFLKNAPAIGAFVRQYHGRELPIEMQYLLLENYFTILFFDIRYNYNT